MPDARSESACYSGTPWNSRAKLIAATLGKANGYLPNTDPMSSIVSLRHHIWEGHQKSKKNISPFSANPLFPGQHPRSMTPRTDDTSCKANPQSMAMGFAFELPPTGFLVILFRFQVLRLGGVTDAVGKNASISIIASSASMPCFPSKALAAA